MKDSIIISYANLWKTMIDKNLNKTQLKDSAHISTNAIAKMGKNEPVSLGTIAKICYSLDCEIGDVVEIIIERGDNDGRI